MISSYDIILNAARKKNSNLLKSELEKVCIDVWKPGAYYFSAASQLASENDREGVEFLRQHGADINFIAVGAAAGRQQDYVELLIEQGANINYIAFGAALAANSDYIQELIEQDQDQDQNLDMGLIVLGYCIGGKPDLSNKFIDEDPKLIKYFAQGVGILGSYQYINELENPETRDDLAYGLAIAGRQEYAEKQRKEGAKIDRIAFGATLGGCQEYVDLLRKEGAGISKIASGAAMGGYRVNAELLRKDANITDMAGSALQGGHYSYAEYLIKEGADIRRVVKAAVESNYIDCEKTTLNFLLSFNDKVRKQLIEAIKKSPHVLHDFRIKIPAISTKINHIKELKNKHQIDYYQTNFLGGGINPFAFFVLLQVLPQLKYEDENRPALNANVIFRIAHYVFPAFSDHQLRTVQNSLNHALLNKAIDDYTDKGHILSRIGIYKIINKTAHVKRALSFQASLNKEGDVSKELRTYCGDQLDLFSGKKSFEGKKLPAHQRKVQHEDQDDFYHAVERAARRSL